MKSDCEIVEEVEVPEAPACAPWILQAARGAFRARRDRARLFGSSLFVDPDWEILLYLFLASEERRGVTVMEACGAAAVPQTTAFRRVLHLVDRKLVIRVPNPKDRRGNLIYLSAFGRQQMLEFFGGLRSYPEVEAE